MTQTTTYRTQRLALGALAIVGVGLAAFWFAKAVMIWLYPESEWVAPLPVAATAGRTVNTPPLDTSFDAFHRDVIVTEVEIPIGQDAPETTLNLTLKGVITGPRGTATIQTPDRRQDSYRIDEEVMSGVTLEAINPGFVIIRRATGLERLSLNDDELFGEPVVPTSQVFSAGPSGAVVQTAENRFTQMVAGDLLRSVSLNRVMQSGRVQGYRLDANGGTSLAQFGLRPGDMVTHINGKDLRQGRPEMGDLMRELGQRNSATLIVLRDGSPVTVRIGQ